MRNKIIEIAKKELGYKEGSGNGNKYSQELYGKSQEWCADFVRWCLIKAGAEDFYPVSSYVPTIAEWFDKKRQYKNSLAFNGNYIPKVGDIVVFDYNHNSTSDHIGLVEYVDGNVLHTIEGNKDNVVKQCTYELNSNNVRAYLTPDYVEVVKKSIEELANEVINNKWGNGSDRKTRLENDGYDYSEVQNKVNQILQSQKTYKVVIANSGLNVRNNANVSATRIAGIPFNCKVEILEENVSNANGYNWDKIKYQNIIGYVANKYLD